MASRSEEIEEIEKVLAAVDRNASMLPDLTRYRQPIEQTIQTIQTLTALQQSLEIRRQNTTRELKAALYELQEHTRRLRSAIRGDLGARNEKLTEFGIAPLRKRRSRK